MKSQKDLGRDDFDVWNAVGQEYLGYDLIEDLGDCKVEPFQVDDVNDSQHVMYNGLRDDAYDRVQEAEQKNTTSFATRGDVLIFTFLMYGDACADPTQHCTGEKYDHRRFRSLTSHELGHFVGLTHVMDDDESVMHPKLKNRQWKPNASDIRALCKWYECIKDPP